MLRLRPVGDALRFGTGGGMQLRPPEIISVATPASGELGSGVVIGGGFSGTVPNPVEYVWSASATPPGSGWTSTATTISGNTWATASPVARAGVVGQAYLYTRKAALLSSVARSPVPTTFTFNASSVTASVVTPDVVVSVAGNPARVTVARSGDISLDCVVNYDITPGTALAGTHYDATGGSSRTMTIPAGQATADIVIGTIAVPGLNAVNYFNVQITGGSINGSAIRFGVPRSAFCSIQYGTAPIPLAPSSTPLHALAFDDALTEMMRPSRFNFVPDDPAAPELNGRRVVLSYKAGQVVLANIDAGNASKQTVIDLSARANSGGDRGLLTAIYHPAFFDPGSAQKFLYVFICVDPVGAAADSSNNRFAQIWRFAMTDLATVANPTPQIILGAGCNSLAGVAGGGSLDFTDPAYVNRLSTEETYTGGDFVVRGLKQDVIVGDADSHQGGAILFNKESVDAADRWVMYVLIGDSGSYNAVAPKNMLAQNRDSSRGKVWRVDPATGKGLSNNPFYQSAATYAANVLGDASRADDMNEGRLFAGGFRNPFSGAIDVDGVLWVMNVGWNRWESLQRVPPGSNHGWPVYEGGNWVPPSGTFVRNADAWSDPARPNYPFTTALQYDAITNPTGIRWDPAVRANTPSCDEVHANPAVHNRFLTMNRPWQAFPHSNAIQGGVYTAQAIVGGQIIEPNTVYPPSLTGDFLCGNFGGGGSSIPTTGPAAAGAMFLVSRTNINHDVRYLGNSPAVITSIPGFFYPSTSSTCMTQGPDGYMYMILYDYNAVGPGGGSKLQRMRITDAFAPPARTWTALNNSVRLTPPGKPAPEEYRLTQAQTRDVGGIVYSSRLDFTANFTLLVDANFGTSGGPTIGGDGIAFVWHNDASGLRTIGAAPGATGSPGIFTGLGARGLRSAAWVGIDTWANNQTGAQVYRRATGVGSAALVVNTSAGWIDGSDPGGIAPTAIASVEDGAWHRFRLSWVRSSNTLTVEIQRGGSGAFVPIQTMIRDLVADTFGGNFAWFAIMSATGGGGPDVTAFRVRPSPAAWTATFEP